MEKVNFQRKNKNLSEDTKLQNKKTQKLIFIVVILLIICTSIGGSAYYLYSWKLNPLLAAQKESLQYGFEDTDELTLELEAFLDESSGNYLAEVKAKHKNRPYIIQLVQQKKLGLFEIWTINNIRRIEKEPINIISPIEKESWIIKETYEIEWTPSDSTGIVEIKLDKIDKITSEISYVWKEEIPNTGNYFFVVPENVGDNKEKNIYQLSIQDITNDIKDCYLDTSLAFSDLFSIFIPVYSGGFGISPPFIKNNNLVPGSHFEETIYLVRGKPELDSVVNAIIEVPGIEDWITINDGPFLLLPKGEQQVPMRVAIDVPLNADYGTYQGHIRVLGISPTTVKEEESGGMKWGVRIDVNLKVNEKITGEKEIEEVKVEVLEEGYGEEAKNNDSLTVHYTGMLEDGTKFDSSIDRGVPFTFVLGIGHVIKGWDLGILGMKIGEKRKLTILPTLGYGEAGVPGLIPSNAILVFEVELLSINE